MVIVVLTVLTESLATLQSTSHTVNKQKFIATYAHNIHHINIYRWVYTIQLLTILRTVYCDVRALRRWRSEFFRFLVCIGLWVFIQLTLVYLQQSILVTETRVSGRGRLRLNIHVAGTVRFIDHDALSVQNTLY